jgi:hypothetical protein
MWTVLSLKPLRSLALGKGIKGRASEIRQMRDIGKRLPVGGHCEYREAMNSMQNRGKRYQHTMHRLTEN